MHRLSISVLSACLVIAAVFVFTSCGKSGGPVIPADSPPDGLHDTTGADGIPSPEVEDDGSPPPALPYGADEPDYAPGEILLTLKPGVFPTDSDGKLLPSSYSAAVGLLTQQGLEIKRVIPTSWNTVYRLNILDGTRVLDKVEDLRTVSEVQYAEPNYRVYYIEEPHFPNDPLWENPNDYDDDPRSTAFEQFGPSKTGASVVWNDTRGEGTVVCVIDTGVQVWHEDLQASMWVNEDEIPDNGIDDDENGYVDDIHGWDTDENDADITDHGESGSSYHGTGCAGVVAATMDNGKGCAGIAPGSRIMGIRIGFDTNFYSAVIEGVEYAKDNGADVISMSFIMSENSDIVRLTMEAAYAAGVILVGGAGNDDGPYIYYPCSWDCVVKVGATSPFSQAWAYSPIDEVRISNAAGFGWGSTYSNGLEIMGYGEHYITTHGSGANKYWDGVNDNFFGGTSNATPMVAAAFALLKSYYPEQTAAWLRKRLRETADDVMDPGYDQYTGYGRMNVIRAVYGADRYAGEEDVTGFVDLEPHAGHIYDSLHAASSGNYIDTQDLYKITAAEDGGLAIDLDIFTWGENLDIQIFSDPMMTWESLLDESIRENHASDSHEIIGLQCSAGETFYIKVFTAATGDSTAYGLSAILVDNWLDIDSGSYDPGFTHVQCSNKLLGYIDFEAGFLVHLRKLMISQQGSMPAEKLAGIHLYRDANGNKSFDGADVRVADGDFGDTNRAIFSGLYEEINFGNSPIRYFITIDLSGITEDAEYELVLTSYKDIGTLEGVEVPYARFPRTFGPFQVGVDIEPPTWNDTVGIQDIDAKYRAAVLYWNAASDERTPPVVYNVYWTQELPFDFGSANRAHAVSSSGGGDYDRMWTLTGLDNGEEYYVAVRAEDQAGNEEENTVYLAVTPSAESDPYAPQIIGSLNTAGNAWEVVTDPANQRVFVADYDGGVLVIDVSDPTKPTLTDYVSAGEVTGLDYDGSYIYAAGASGLLIVDPDGADGSELVTLVPFSSALDACVVGHWVYVTQFATGLLPVDVTNPASPVTHPVVTSGTSGYGMDAQNGYLYVATNDRPRVFDLSDPSAPANTGASFGGTYAYEIDAVGDRLYITYWFNHAFSIYTLADPANPSFIQSWTSNSGYYASDIITFNGYLYFGTNYSYIESLNVDDPFNIFELGQVWTNGPDGMETDGTFIYSAENEHGLKVIL